MCFSPSLCVRNRVSYSRPGWFACQYSTNQKDSKADVEDEDQNTPYSYSTSKAAGWNVEKSFGSQYSRPWWKVAPLSVALCAFVLWVFLRSESDLDRRLEVTLREQIPDLFPPIESESKEDDDSTSDSIGTSS